MLQTLNGRPGGRGVGGYRYRLGGRGQVLKKTFPYTPITAFSSPLPYTPITVFFFAPRGITPLNQNDDYPTMLTELSVRAALTYRPADRPTIFLNTTKILQTLKITGTLIGYPIRVPY